jgi:hypothetical protein
MRKPRLISLTFIGFHLTAALDDEKGDAVTFADVYEGLENRSLFKRLKVKLPDSFDFSLFEEGGEEEAAIFDVLDNVAGGLQGRERRKMGIEKSGVSLLLGFILEAIQQREWV